MNNRNQLDLTKEIESWSTWWDHFRHIYEFVEALYSAIDTGIVDYDVRKRNPLIKENIEKYQLQLTHMINTIWWIYNKKLIIKASKTYPTLQAVTSFQRELQALLSHEQDHHTYVTQKHNTKREVKEWIQFSFKEKIDIPLLSLQSLQDDVKFDFEKYNLIVQHIILPVSITHHYKQLCIIFNYLQQYTTDNIVVLNWELLSSLSNEYYKLEEELMHMLYDIRLYIRDTDPVYFHKIITQDPQFWIARSTIVNLSLK